MTNFLKLSGLTMLAFLICLNKSIAQEQLTSDDSLLIKAFATDQLLPLLIDSAIKYSSEVERARQIVEYAKNVGKINKNAIYSGLSFGTSYNYGTNYSAVNNASNTTNNISALTKAQTGYYNVGIGFQLPITQFLNRKSIIQADQSQIKAGIADKEKIILFLKQEVIRLYQDLKLSQKLIALSSKNKQAAEINYAMEEKNFIQGQSPIVEITSIQDVLNKAGIEFETYINRFQTNYMQLEAITGTDISKLIKTIK